MNKSGWVILALALGFAVLLLTGAVQINTGTGHISFGIGGQKVVNDWRGAWNMPPINQTSQPAPPTVSPMPPTAVAPTNSGFNTTSSAAPVINHYQRESWWVQNPKPGNVIGWNVTRDEATCAPGRHLEPTNSCQQINGSMVCANACANN